MEEMVWRKAWSFQALSGSTILPAPPSVHPPGSAPNPLLSLSGHGWFYHGWLNTIYKELQVQIWQEEIRDGVGCWKGDNHTLSPSKGSDYNQPSHWKGQSGQERQMSWRKSFSCDQGRGNKQYNGESTKSQLLGDIYKPQCIVLRDKEPKISLFGRMKEQCAKNTMNQTGTLQASHIHWLLSPPEQHLKRRFIYSN